MQQQVYKCPNHGLNLNKMRLNNKWCDVIIKVEEKEYPAHKSVLAANLTHFEAMFNSDTFQESQHGVATMKNIRAKDLEQFIIYAYTGELTVTDVNALDLLELADYLKEDEIKDACIDFLGRHLKAEDAFRAYRLASVTGCLSLKNKAKDEIMKKFVSCLKTPDYLNLECEKLKDILSWEKVKIKPQEMFDGIIRWTLHDISNRKNRVNELLILIDARKLTADYLMSYHYKNIMNRADEYEISKSVMSWYYARHQSDQAKQHKEALMIIGTCAANRMVCQQFDFAQKKWSQIQEVSDEFGSSLIRFKTNAALVDDKFYFITIRNYFGLFAETERLAVFDPMSKQIQKSIENTGLGGSAVCSSSTFVYLCGGWDVTNNSTSDEIQRYDPETKSFKRLPPMRVKRMDAASIIIGGCLYVLGGRDGSSYWNSVEKCDPVTKAWSLLPSMCQPRSNHAVAVLEGKLYACGGLLTNSAEVYEPLENRWKRIDSMNKTRSDFVLVAHDGKLRAVGGGSFTVESYDPSIDQWQIDTEMSLGLEISNPIGGLITKSFISTE